MKREHPGRSVLLIVRELESNGVVSRDERKPTVLRRLLRSKGLSGPQMKVAAVERYRFVAESCNGLWEGDACHGPKIYDPAQGGDVRITCAQLGIRLVFARLQPGAVETIDDLNLRISTWVHSDYNVRPHAGVGGRTPLSVFEDHAELEANFVAHIQRTVQADATCSVTGVAYEVPQHFRGRKVTLHYAVLKPGTYWIEEGGVRVPVTGVDAKANFTRRRRAPVKPAPDEPWSATGMNAVEDMLRRRLHPKESEPDERQSDEGDGDVQSQGASF